MSAALETEPSIIRLLVIEREPPLPEEHGVRCVLTRPSARPRSRPGRWKTRSCSAAVRIWDDLRMAWTCPDCGRRFGRKNQAHGCAPGQSVDDFFANRPAALRRAFDAIARHLMKTGGVEVEAVTVCVMFKRSRSFAEVRARRDRLVLGFLLSRVVEHSKITRTLRLSAHRTAHFVDIARPADVDRNVRDWLSEAYACSPV